MKLYFFTVPAKFPEEAQQTMNVFCAQHRVLAVEKQFVNLGNESYWSICVTVMEQSCQEVTKTTSSKRVQVDYKEILSEHDFALYIQLRNLRKVLSEQEGIPAYALFTNEQLAKIVTQRVNTLTELAQIDGIGKARLEKYGEVFLQALHAKEEGVVQSYVSVNHETKKD